MKTLRTTGKAKGLKVGDFVSTGMFPAIIISGVHTTTPMCDVWGIEHEMGSVYADDLSKITPEEFAGWAARHGHVAPYTSYSEVAKKALSDAGLAVEP